MKQASIATLALLATLLVAVLLIRHTQTRPTSSKGAAHQRIGARLVEGDQEPRGTSTAKSERDGGRGRDKPSTATPAAEVPCEAPASGEGRGWFYEDPGGGMAELFDSLTDDQLAAMLRRQLQGPQDGQEALALRMDDRALALTWVANDAHRLRGIRSEVALALAQEVRAAYDREMDPHAKCALLRILASLPGQDAAVNLALGAMTPGVDPSVQRAAIETLAAHLDVRGVIGALCDAARSEEASPCRMMAIRALGPSPDPQARAMLLDILTGNSSPSVKMEAANALARQPAGGAYEALALGYERNDDHAVKSNCLTSLAVQDTAKGWEFISRAATDAQDAFVRSTAERLLKHHNDPSQISAPK